MMSPVSGSGSTGVSMVTFPSFDESGHDGALVVSSAICAGEHAPSPAADDGDTVKPSGNVIATMRTCAVDRPSGSLDCGTLRSTLNADGASATRDSDLTSIVGANGKLSHPSKTSGV